MTPIAVCIDRILARYVGAWRVLDDRGLGSEEAETPIRRTRAAALADARAAITERPA